MVYKVMGVVLAGWPEQGPTDRETMKSCTINLANSYWEHFTASACSYKEYGTCDFKWNTLSLHNITQETAGTLQTLFTNVQRLG